MMRKVFAGLYALDGLNGVDPVKNALKSPTQFVLKPQREGGGNNLYGDAMVDVLKTFDKNAAVGHKGDLSQYILMQRIFPPTNTSLCLRKGELRTLETLSELGVYGGYVRVGGTFFYPVISCSPHTA
jgi:glutathione synthase